ncbi:MAG: hypothetical protein Q4615_06385 [Paracoccus aminovorans]|nr:hypothetical protein [Paracoccus aminovorans]
MVYTPSARALYVPERSLDECLRLWGTVQVRAKGATHRAFAERIAHQASRPEWVPGVQQMAFIRQLVDLYAYDDIALDPELIEMLRGMGGTNDAPSHSPAAVAPG